MAKKLFNSLFGRQLSHGSENEEPANLEEAFSEPPQLQQNITPDVSNFSPQLTPQFQVQQQIGGLSLSSETAPGGKEMNVAYNAANFIVRDRIMNENPEDIAVLDSMSKSDIIVVRGTYDHIHLVLEAVGIPFMTVNPVDLTKMELYVLSRLCMSTTQAGSPQKVPRDWRSLSGLVDSSSQLIGPLRMSLKLPSQTLLNSMAIPQGMRLCPLK